MSEGPMRKKRFPLAHLRAETPGVGPERLVLAYTNSGAPWACTSSLVLMTPGNDGGGR